MLKRTENVLRSFDELETSHDSAIMALKITTKALNEAIMKMDVRNSHEYAAWHKVYEKYFRMLKQIEQAKLSASTASDTLKQNQ